MKEAVEADKEAFRLFSEGKSVVPLRTNISAPKHDGAFLFMPSYVEEMDCSAIKIVNVFPKNIDKGLPSTPAQVLLIDGTTGVVVSVLDGTYVTQLRTGAASGAAFDVLARKDAKKGALIGTGGQAATQLLAFQSKGLVCDEGLPGSRVQRKLLERNDAHVAPARRAAQDGLDAGVVTATAVVCAESVVAAA